MDFDSDTQITENYAYLFQDKFFSARKLSRIIWNLKWIEKLGLEFGFWGLVCIVFFFSNTYSNTEFPSQQFYIILNPYQITYELQILRDGKICPVRALYSFP